MRTSARRSGWRPFVEARAFTRTLKLQNVLEWAKYSRGLLPNKPSKPNDIPAAPRTVYADEWVDWGDWLGTGRARREWRPFERARAFVHALELRSQRQWFDYVSGRLPDKASKPDDIPASPHTVYQREWISSGDWLGTGRRRGNWRPFNEARAFVHGLGLTGQSEWARYAKGQIPSKGTKPDDIPASPHAVYSSEWKSWGDWLGTGTLAPSKRKYKSFKPARKFAQNLGLKNRVEWVRYAKGDFPDKGIKPDDIPANPRDVYLKKGWQGMGDWLGTGRRRGGWREFTKARKFVHVLQLQSGTDWRRYCAGKLSAKGTKPDDIPYHPYRTYKGQGWAGWRDWLGTTTKAKKRRGTNTS